MNIHRDQRIIKQFNWFLDECLFTFPYSPEINFTSGKRSTQWVKRLLEVASPLNSQATRLTDYYECVPQRWPNVFHVDPGHELVVEVTREMAKHGVTIKRRNVNIHRDQEIIEQFNWTLDDHLLTVQFGIEINFYLQGNELNGWKASRTCLIFE